MSDSQKKPIYFILATIVLDMLGVGLIIPVLPDVIRRFEADPSQLNHLFGLFISSYALMQFFASPILGALSDRYGRRPVLLGSLMGAAIDYVFMAFSPSLILLFVGRFFSGLTGASMTVANSYMADISDSNNRSARFGMIGAAFGIGFILGPSLGGLLGEIDYRAPFIAAAVLNLLNFLFGYFVLPESLKPENKRNIELNKLNPIGTFLSITRHKNILIYILCYGLVMLAGNVHPNIWTLYTENKFGWSAFDVGLSLSFVGLIYGFSQAVLTRKLVPIWGEQKSLLVGLVFAGIGYLAYALVNQGWMVYGVMLATCLSGLVAPCLQSIMTSEVEVDRQGELQGGLVSMISIISIISPMVYTASLDWGLKQSERFYIGAPYFVAALIIFICGLFLFNSLNKKAVLSP